MSLKRKNFYKIFIALFVILIIASVLYYQAERRFNSEKIIFSMNDPKGDDYGPGTFKYPWAAIFDPKKEHLDLVKFRMSEVGNKYCFDMVFPRVTNPWGAPEGFSHPITEIYLADGTLSGRSEPLRKGSNVLFNHERPWQYMVKVVSFNGTAVYSAGDHEEAEGKREGITTRLMSDKKTIRASIPKALLPGDPGRWYFYVIVGSQDGSGPDNFRIVNASPTQWNFGGGTDTDFDPNVIDLLAAKGEQERVLSSYWVDSRSLAVISPVKGVPPENSFWENFLDYLIDIFHGQE